MSLLCPTHNLCFPDFVWFACFVCYVFHLVASDWFQLGGNRLATACDDLSATAGTTSWSAIPALERRNSWEEIEIQTETLSLMSDNKVHLFLTIVMLRERNGSFGSNPSVHFHFRWRKEDMNTQSGTVRTTATSLRSSWPAEPEPSWRSGNPLGIDGNPDIQAALLRLSLNWKKIFE